MIPDADLMNIRSTPGRTCVTITAPSLHERQAAIIGQRLRAEVEGRTLEIDVSKVEVFTVAFVNALLELAGRAAAVNGRLSLRGVSPDAWGILRRTGAHQRMRIKRRGAGVMAKLHARFAGLLGG